MSNIPDGLLYTKDDEWVKVDGDIATVGITDYAQDSLSDIVYLELPDIGASYDQNETFGVVESVKAAADLYMPLAGEVTEVNSALIDAPETVNSDPFGAAWMVKLRIADVSQLDDLLSPDDYRAHVADRE